MVLLLSDEAVFPIQSKARWIIQKVRFIKTYDNAFDELAILVISRAKLQSERMENEWELRFQKKIQQPCPLIGRSFEAFYMYSAS